MASERIVSIERGGWPLGALAMTALVVLVVLATLGPGAARALELRLETGLVVDQPGPSDARTEALVRFGASDLSRRIERVRIEARELRQRNQELATSLERQESLLDWLRTLSDSQDVAIEGLRSTVDARRAGPARAAPAPSQPLNAAGAMVAATSGTSPEATPATPAPAPTRAEPRVAAPAPAPVAGGTVAGVDTPGWMLEAGLAAGALVLVGGLAALLRRRRRAAPVVLDTSSPVAASPASVAPAAATGERPAIDASDEAGSETLGLLDGKQLEAEGSDTFELTAAAPAAPARPEPATVSQLRPAPSNRHTAGTDRTSGVAPEPDDTWSAADIRRKTADPQVLKEVDTLIAFEQFDKAKALLDQMLVDHPENPEYLLRHYHVRTHGGVDTCTDDEEMLRMMMDGPLSDTLLRVRSIGQGLMPGDPLFHDSEERQAAVAVLGQGKAETRTGTGTEAGTETPAPRPDAPADSPGPESFDKTVTLRLVPMD